MSTVQAFVRDERGGVAVLFAVLTPAFLFLFLLVVDVGNWYVHKRHLQMEVDAAALAGGAYFGDCFSSDSSIAGAADDTIRNAATKYGGGPGSAYNVPGGGASMRITTRFNSKTFAVGGPGADDTETNGPCETPHLMLDVKQTEADVPFILGGLISAFIPSAKTTIDAINARARVELKKETIVQGSLPLAVPDVDPRHVTVTFVDEATGAAIGPALSLTKGSSVNGLNYWTGSAAVAVPADKKIGARIGVGAGWIAACGAAACAAAAAANAITLRLIFEIPPQTRIAPPSAAATHWRDLLNLKIARTHPHAPLRKSLPVEHQQLRELLAFPVGALVGDGHDLSVRRDLADGDADDLAVALLFGFHGQCIDPHRVQRVVVGRSAHRIVLAVQGGDVAHLHRLAARADA